MLTPSSTHQEFFMYGVNSGSRVIGALAFYRKNDLAYSFQSFGLAEITGAPNPNTGEFVVTCGEYSRLYVNSSMPFTFRIV